MVFTLAIERDEVYSFSLGLSEYQYRSVKQYATGLNLGVPPRLNTELKKAIDTAQPHDILNLDDAHALQNIHYTQAQLDLVSYHAMTIRQALAPVISAFDHSPKDMGVVMNFCT